MKNKEERLVFIENKKAIAKLHKAKPGHKKAYDAMKPQINLISRMIKKQQQLEQVIIKQTSQLELAIGILRYYANPDVWKYVGVKQESPGGFGTDTYYTSFESYPLRDGWAWAKEVLEKINAVGRQQFVLKQRLKGK